MLTNQTDKQETRLEQLAKEKQKLNEEVARFQEELLALVRSLTIDHRLN